MSSQFGELKVAIVHDWLIERGGAEKVVLAIHELFPNAPIYTSVYLPKRLKMKEYEKLDIRTSFIQKLPFFNAHHKFAFLLRALAFWRLDLSGYDLVISSTTAEAKAVKTKRENGEGALHICYCNTPTRYYWSGFEQYLAQPGFGALNPLARFALRVLIKPLRKMDLKLATRPDIYIGNSTAVTERIKKYYQRKAFKLFPSVETEKFTFTNSTQRSGFVIAGRQVPYKRVDLAIKACNKLKLPLIVVGEGTEHDRLVAIAGPTISFKAANDTQLAKIYGSAEALLYPCEEDAGIVPVEAMSCGTPTIAYNQGGALDYVVDGKTGVLFNNQTVDALCNAIQKSRKIKWDYSYIHVHAQKFSRKTFQKQLTMIVKENLTS